MKTDNVLKTDDVLKGEDVFRFRLDSILRLREHKEKLCRDEVVRYLHQLRLAKEKEEALQREIGAVLTESVKVREGRVSLQDTLMRLEYLRYLQKMLSKQKELIRDLFHELSLSRMRLTEAMKERKIIGKLREKQEKAYLFQADKREQAFLDDLANSSLRGRNNEE